jgi:malonyl-CoA O-methyltransferase
MSGTAFAGGKEAMERFGGVRVLAEIPPLARVDAAAVDEVARSIAPPRVRSLTASPCQ